MSRSAAGESCRPFERIRLGPDSGPSSGHDITLRISNVVEAQIAGRQAASRYLKALVSIGMLREQVFGREKLFVNAKLLDLLTRDEDGVDSHSR